MTNLQLDVDYISINQIDIFTLMISKISSPSNTTLPPGPGSRYKSLARPDYNIS